MIDLVRPVLTVALTLGLAAAAAAQQQPAAQQPAQQQPAQQPAVGPPPPPGLLGQPARQTPTTQTPTVPGTTPAPATQPGAPPVTLTPATSPACPAPVPPATLPARSFTAPTGLLLHQVAPTRVADFENLLNYVRQALATTTNATLRNQARGWQFFRIAEAGPNGDVLYAFLINPAVPCVDYALGPVLADAYSDPSQAAQLQEIWKLYTGAVRNGGTLMNLVPLPLAPPTPVGSPSTTVPATTPELPPATTSGTTAPVPGAAPVTQPPAVPLDAKPVNRP